MEREMVQIVAYEKYKYSGMLNEIALKELPD